MFERFTEQARRTVVLAQESARVLSHNYLGTEHLLLGLLRHDGGVAHRALDLFDVSWERAEGEVRDLVGRGPAPPGSNIPFTSSAKQALERSQWESRQLRHGHIGTEHILLGLLGSGDSTALRVLEGLEVDPGVLRTAVLQLVDAGARDSGEGEGEDELVVLAGEGIVGGAPSGPAAPPIASRPEPAEELTASSEASVALQLARLTAEVAALRDEVARLAAKLEGGR